MKTKLTFWQLISDYQVHIPTIQRDYAQGRRSARGIAEKFLLDLRESLRNSQGLNLDFVYGRTNDSILTPLDGQQRLTTLFLLHWYLALHEHKLDDQVKSILCNFSYETRPSAHDFCQELVERAIDNPNPGKLLSEEIRDSKWYFLSWDKDPTVDSILNMLDLIQSHFAEETHGMFDLLLNTGNCPITFHFLPMKDFNLSDELYIKMNARGKPLTKFEHFKVNLSKSLTTPHSKSKLDNKWLDIFWNIAKQEEEIAPGRVDTMYYNFLDNITLNFYVENNEIDKDFIDEYDLFSIYTEIKSPDSSFIDNLTNILDAISNLEKISPVFVNFLQSRNLINYWERLRFYALSQFYLKFGSPNDENIELYNEWTRVCYNLISNTLTQGPVQFREALQSIKALSNHIDDFYNYVKNNSDEIKYFNRDQRREEALKINLISKEESWLQLFTGIEKHSYFDGQIGFILELCKDQSGEYSQAQFKDYSSKLALLFSDDFKEDHEFLFQRALLTFGDFLPQVGRGDNYTFCVFDETLRTKLENWRNVFNKKAPILKLLLDNISLATLTSDLTTIVEVYSDDTWRSKIVGHPEYIRYCNKRQIRKLSDNSIHLLSKSQMNSWHQELHSLHFYDKQIAGLIFPPFEETKYLPSTTYATPCIVLDKWKYKGSYFAIDIGYSQNYYIRFFDRQEKPCNVIIQSALLELGFSTNSEAKHIDYRIDLFGLGYPEISSKVREICHALDEVSKTK